MGGEYSLVEAKGLSKGNNMNSPEDASKNVVKSATEIVAQVGRITGRLKESQARKRLTMFVSLLFMKVS